MSGAFWHARRSAPGQQLAKSQTEMRPAPEFQEKEWTLTANLVSIALQRRTISTKHLRRNSDDEIVWRWLKKSITEYPQNWVKLNISESGHYFVEIYSPAALDQSKLAYINSNLKERGLPLLEAGKRYAELQVSQAGIICPEWYGVIDLDAPRLMYFEGRSG
jgi:short subunit dehydrogenase-like uncharacterized protein